MFKKAFNKLLPRREGQVTESEEGTESGGHGHCSVITKNRVWLVQKIDVNNTLILDQLTQDGVISQSQLTALKERNATNYQRVSALLDHLQTRTKEDWEKFMNCLSKHDHSHVVETIQATAPGKSNRSEVNQGEPESPMRGSCSLEPTNPPVAPPGENETMLRLSESWQLQVANHYLRYNNRISVCPYGPYQRDQSLDSLFIPPSCSILNRDDKTECDVSDICDIFRYAGKARSTFITGLPGSGKTTLMNWCLSTWAELVLDNADGSGYGNKPDFMHDLIICLFLRHVKPGVTLSQAIKDQIWCDPECYPHIDRFIRENPSRSLIIFDGLDEYRPETSSDITAIIQGQMLPNVSKVVTSRHTKASSPSAELVRHYSKRVQINGFDDSRVLQYMFKYKGLPAAHTKLLTPTDKDKKKSIDELYKKIKTQNMLSLCHIPLHLCFFCQLSDAGKEISKNKTQLYLMIVKYILDANLSKTTSVSDFTLHNIQVNHDDLFLCGTGGLVLLRGEHDRFTFTRETGELGNSQNFLDIGIKLGLIVPVQPEHLGDTKLYTFIHLSVQEFVASYAIVHNKTQRQLFISHLTDIFRLHDCRNIISFCCGMSEQCGNELLSHAVRLVRNSKDNPTAHQCPYFNPSAWHSGKVSWEAESNISSDISYFVAQCVAEYGHQNRCDIPLPEYITFDLSQSEKDGILTMFRHNKSKGQVKVISIKNGDLSRDTWDTAKSVILPHELKQLYLFLNYIQDTAALAASINQMNNLTILVLQIQSLTETDSERILSAIPQTIPLVSLSLRYFRLNPRGADIFSELTGKLKHLVRLDVSDTDLSLLGPRVTSRVTSQHLAWLQTNDTHLTRQQMTSLCAALPGQCPRLLQLSISGNNMCGMEHRVTENLSKFNHLSWLSIRNCNITSHGLWQILQSLPRSLRLLDISDNGFTHFSQLSKPRNILHLRSLRFLRYQITAVPAKVTQRLVSSCKQTLPDLILMYDDKSYKAGKQALDAFIVEQYSKILARECSVNGQ